jgi:hypothetical protein
MTFELDNRLARDAFVIGDPAWPGPVWGHGATTPYDDGVARVLIGAARDGMPIQPIQASTVSSLPG